MRTFTALTALALFASTAAFAQTTPPANPPATPPAGPVTPPSATPPATPPAATPPAAPARDAMSTVPPNSVTVTNYYKQNVYDRNDKKVGQIVDVLVTDDGKITALVIGAGGFLGMGKHDVAVPFSAVKATKKNDKWYLTMDASVDSLKASPGLKYDRATTTWIPDTADDSKRPRKK